MFIFHKRKRVFYILLIFLHAVSKGLCQRPVVSLSNLNDSADHYLPRILGKKAQLSSASAAIIETRHQFLPALRFNEQLNLGSDNSVAGSYFSYGIVPSSSSGVREANDYQAAAGNIAILYGEYDLVDFGYKNARIGFAKSQETLSKADLQRELYILHGRICRAYFNLMVSEARMAIEKETVKRYDTIFNIISALTLSGIRPGSDSSLAKAELSKSRITYNQITGQAENYREEISYLTGVSTAQIRTDTALMAINSKRNMFYPQADSADNPLIDYYAELSKLYISNERLIAKSYLPKIRLTAASWARGSSIQYEDQYKSVPEGLGYQRFNYLAGVSFQYNLFNGLHKKDRLKTFGFEREATELEFKQQQVSLASALRQAQNSIDISEQNLVEMPVQYQSAVDTYNQKVAQYKAGLITLIDLTNAAFVLDRSLNDYAGTIGNWYLAQLDKAIATGNLPGFIQSIH
jgi:outer membrane protein TolC